VAELNPIHDDRALLVFFEVVDGADKR